MRCFLSFLCLPLICFSPVLPASSVISLPLSDARTLEVDLAEARLISELEGYAIIAGRSCVDCDENTAIYFEKIEEGESWSHPPELAEGRDSARADVKDVDVSDPGLDDGEETGNTDTDRAQVDGHEAGALNLVAERFSYPGKYRDYLSKQLVEKTRMFYGRCHENSPAVVWLSEYRTQQGWVKAEYLIVFRDGEVEHRYNEHRQPSIYYIEDEACHEVPGIETTTEP